MTKHNEFIRYTSKIDFCDNIVLVKYFCIEKFNKFSQEYTTIFFKETTN